MPNLEAQAAWVPVREIGIELARGGPNGNMNEQAKALLARTEFLNQQKVDKEYVDQKLIDAKEYDRTFDSETELKNFIPDSIGFIAKAWDTHKVFKWEGEIIGWKDLGLSQLDLAKDYFDNTINGAKIKKGINLADLSKIIPGHYINYTNGLIGDQLDHSVLGPYKVTPNLNYKVPSNYDQQFAFYDDAMNYISGLALPPSNKIISIPADAKYIKLTVPNNQINTFMFCKEFEYPTVYTPFIVELENAKLESEQINNFSSKIEGSLGIECVNILDKSKVEVGYYFGYENGLKAPAPSSPAYCCGIYPIISNTEYRVTPLYTQAAFYDSNMVYISGLSSVPTGTFTTPINATYIGLTIRVDDLDSYMLCKSQDFPTKYIPHFKELKGFKVTSEQILDLDETLSNYLESEPLNIINTETVINDMYVAYINGMLGNNSDFVATDFLNVKPNTEYETSRNYNQQFAFYDENKNYISGQSTATPAYKFITPSNAKFIRLSIEKSKLSSVMVAESSIFPSTYVPHEMKIVRNLILENSENKINERYVSADEYTDEDFTGKNGIQLALNSITDASEKNRYKIIAKGLFKLDKASDVIGYPGYPSMILMKDHVDLIGDGNTVLWLELPYEDTEVGLSNDGGNYPRNRYQTLYTYAHNSLIQDITFVAKNIRYALHLDNPGGANKRHDFKNVNFIFKGDKGSQQALGCGTSTGEQTFFEGGSCHSDYAMPFYCHNNSKFLKPSLMSFNNFKFSSNESKYAAELQNDGSLVKDKVELIGCSFSGSAYVLLYDENWLYKNTALKYDYFDHAEWTFSGYGNDPFLFVNNVEGLSLHFKTTGLGIDKTIRFDKTSSAYPVLIKNNHVNADVSLYLDGREYLDGYIIQDGSVGLSAQAWGCLDVSEKAGIYDDGVVYTSLGKRLGNCSIFNKTLGVIINGTTITVTFNKDYTSMSNSAIVAEINADLIGATVNLISYGRDYYPLMSDVTEIAFNTTDAPILKGSVITKSGGSVHLANGNDKVYGVALDDIPVVQTTADGVKKGQGRVLKRGYLYASPSEAHYVLANVHIPTVGTRFKVVNGQLIEDVNGNFRCEIDDGVISINC